MKNAKKLIPGAAIALVIAAAAKFLGKPAGERRTALYRGIGHRHVYRYDCECLLQAEQRDSAGN